MTANPCKTCGEPSMCSDTVFWEQCKTCYEVEKRIDKYLKSKLGYRKVLQKLAELYLNKEK